MSLSGVFLLKLAPLKKMFVVTAVSNVSRYVSRYRLYRRFKQMCEHAGINLITVELAFGQRAFEVTTNKNVLHCQLRSHEEFWHKENLLNLGIAHGRKLYPHADKVCWIDADCRPARPPRDWFNETWHMLQHYKFVQMWEWFQPLCPDYSPVCSPSPSFMANYVKFGTPYPKNEAGYPKQWGSPGLAWAADLSALEQIGGLPDKAILGAGDWYLSHMLISDLNIPEMGKYTSGYREYWSHIQTLCDRWIKKDVGYVKGLVYHDWHGKTVDRGYNSREKILIRNRFDPRTDIKRDTHGLYQMETHEPRQIKMYDQIRAYFRARNEDSIDVP